MYLSGFGYPVVPQGQARLRCQVSAAHTREQLDRAVSAIAEVAEKFGVMTPAAATAGEGSPTDPLPR